MEAVKIAGSVARVRPVDVGLLAMRIGLGIMFMLFGLPKITGGPEKWAELGQAMSALGIGFAPAFWGFMAAVSEFAGGLALLLGVLVRPFAFLMMCTMIVATAMLVRSGAGMVKFSHALDMAIVFLGLLVAGGGRLGLGRLVPPIRGKWYQ